MFVGKTMEPLTSPNDPAFFLHHCNVDRVYESYLQSHGPYSPNQVLWRGVQKISNALENTVNSAIATKTIPAIPGLASWCSFVHFTTENDSMETSLVWSMCPT